MEVVVALHCFSESAKCIVKLSTFLCGDTDNVMYAVTMTIALASSVTTCFDATSIIDTAYGVQSTSVPVLFIHL